MYQDFLYRICRRDLRIHRPPCDQERIVPDHCEQSTCVAVPRPRPTPEFWKSAAEAPDYGLCQQLMGRCICRYQGAYINASVKIDISAILVRATEPVLRAKWVTLLRTKIVDFDYDAIPGVVKTSARAVGLDGKPPAGPARWALAIALIVI